MENKDWHRGAGAETGVGTAWDLQGSKEKPGSFYLQSDGGLGLPYPKGSLRQPLLLT